MRIMVKQAYPDGKKLCEVYADSTETKPTTDIAQGSTLMELNATAGTLNCYMFSEGAGDWVDIGGGNG